MEVFRPAFGHVQSIKTNHGSQMKKLMELLFASVSTLRSLNSCKKEQFKSISRHFTGVFFPLLIIFGLLTFINISLGANQAFAAIAFVKNIGVASSTATGTTLSVTVPTAGVAAGTSIIVSLAMNPSAGSVSCTDTRLNSYTIDRDITSGSGTTGVRTVILSAHNVLSLSSGNAITCTHPSVTARALSANAFSGLASMSARDKAAATTGSSTVPFSGSTPTTTQPSELLFGTIGVEGPSKETFTAGASYTTIGRIGTSGGSSTNNITVNPEYRLVTATGAYSAGGTLSVAHRWAAAIVTIRLRRRLILPS